MIRSLEAFLRDTHVEALPRSTSRVHYSEFVALAEVLYVEQFGKELIDILPVDFISQRNFPLFGVKPSSGEGWSIFGTGRNSTVGGLHSVIYDRGAENNSTYLVDVIEASYHIISGLVRSDTICSAKISEPYINDHLAHQRTLLSQGAS